MQECCIFAICFVGEVLGWECGGGGGGVERNREEAQSDSRDSLLSIHMLLNRTVECVA